MRAPLGVALAVACLAACAVEEAPAVETAVSYIRFGTPAAVGQFPQVVALVFDDGRRGLCTGTLVAPDIVLTAAHCVDPATLGYADPAEVTAATTVVLDDVDLQAAPPGRAIAAADTRAMPGFEVPGDPDVGLVFLAEPVTDRPVAALNHDADAVAVGTPVDLVGFGETEAGTFGRLLFTPAKESVSCRGYDVSDDEFLCLDQQTGGGICSGDSGGPAFATIGGAPRIVGITSFGDQDCTVLGAHMRVDAAATRAFLDDHAPELLCRVDGACDAACPAGIDPDCDEVPTVDAAEVADDAEVEGDEVSDDAAAEGVADAAAGCAAGGGAGGTGTVAALALAVTGWRRRSPSRR